MTFLYFFAGIQRDCARVCIRRHCEDIEVEVFVAERKVRRSAADGARGAMIFCWGEACKKIEREGR